MKQPRSKPQQTPHLELIPGEPEVGRMYIVPCVRLLTNGAWIPVFGTLHSDPELFGKDKGPDAHLRHYHHDFRFTSPAQLWELFHVRPEEGTAFDWRRAMAFVTPENNMERDDQGRVIVRNLIRRCYRRMPQFPVQMQGASEAPRKQFLTAKVELLCEGRGIDPENPVCPHRGFSLRGLPVDAEGCITCPGHGLRFDATSGEQVSRYDSPQERAQLLASSQQHRGAEYGTGEGTNA